ncbi:Ig-like domain-containing protein [Leeuwenhoekiella sp. LLG6367-2.1]|uniref:Ig-like domain-containing protein n=1 Tax=Leeuwenhoekiella sp. LLG6367-2.1 TaxID=3160833 RepID=UPI00386679C3
MQNSTFQKIKINLLFFLILFSVPILSVFSQTRTFATNELDSEYVTSVPFAIDGNLNTEARIRAYSGITALGVVLNPPTVGVLELGYDNPIPAEAVTYVKIEAEDQIIDVLLGGTLGGLVGDVLDIVLGGQRLVIEAKNGNTTVLTADTRQPNTFNTNRVRVVIDANGDFFIALKPNQTYSSIRITNSTGNGLLGLGTTRDAYVSGAFTASGSAICNEPAFTSFRSNGVTLDALRLAGAGVTNPENAIDSDPTTFSQISLGLLAVAGSVEQNIYFDTPSQPDEDFKVSLRVDPTLLAVGLANNIELVAYNGTQLVSSSNLTSLLNLDLLGLLQSNAIVQVPFDVAGPADRIVVRYQSLVNASLFQRIDLFDVAITSGIPILDSESLNAEVCVGESAALTATTNTAGAQLRWYDSVSGDNLLATVNSGDAFTTNALTEDTTFYVASYLPSCAEESGRIPVEVTVNPLPESGDITVLGLDLPICIPEILNIIATTTLEGNFKYYLDSNGSVEITNGLVDGDLTYEINAEGELEIKGLTGANTPTQIYISLVDAVTGCENAPGDLKVVEITLNEGPQPTIALDPITGDGIINKSESSGPVAVTGTVGGDAQVGDPVTVTVNTFEYDTTVLAGLTFTVNVPGNQLVSDADLTIEAEVTATELLCQTTVSTSITYLLDVVAPAKPTVESQITNNTTPTITGTLDSVDEISVTVNTVTYLEGDGDLTDNGDGTWTLMIPSGNEILDGTYDVVATVTDAAGNTASDDTTNELIIDTIDPTIPTVFPQITSDTTPTIMGTADSVDLIEVSVNSITYLEGDGNLVDNGNGTWTLIIPVGNELANGTYDVAVTAVDLAGNSSSDITLNELIIDNTIPTTPTVVPQVTSNTTPTITGTADSDDVLTVTVDGVIYTEGDGNLTDNTNDTWSLTIPSALADGIYDVKATVVGIGGTATDATINELTIDTVAPTVPTVDELVANTSTPTITGTLDSADEISVIVNTVTYTEGDGDLVDNGDGTWELEIPVGNEIPDGTYDVEVTVTDNAGNTASDVTVDELTIDTVAPTVPTVDVLVTNTSTPTITGTLDSADDISVIVNGVTYTEGDDDLVDNGDGTWELAIPVGNEIPDGTYDVDVTVTDTAGNTASDATVDELIIDTVAPTVPTVDVLVTNTSTPTITGTLDSADDISVVVDGVTYTEGDGNLTDNGDGTWELEIPVGNEIPDGTYDVDVTVTDDAGNTASDATVDELIIDTVAPTVPTVDELVANTSTPTITGTLDSADEISVIVNTVTYTEGDGDLVDNGNGTWELVIPVGNEIPDGTYDVDVTVTDTAGNTASDATVDELIIDTVAPTVPTVDVLVTNTSTPTITGTLDSADEISVTVNTVTYTEGDGNLTDNGDGTWELEIPVGNEIPDGTYDVDVTATDVAGNTTSDATVDELIIDTVAPTVPTVDELVATTNTPTITGTLDSADEISIIVNGVTYTEGDGNLTDNGDGTWELEIPVGNEIPDGTYDVDVTVTDDAGNTASDATVDELTIDTVAPTVPTVDELIANTSTPTITGTLDSADDISVIVNGVTYTEGDGNLTDNGDGTWELVIPVGNEILDGTYNVDVTVTDTAGNTASDVTVDELTIDTVAPTVPTVDELVANTNTPTITGTLDSADEISVLVNGITYTEGDGNLTDNGDGTWELEIPIGNEIPDGTYDVEVTVTDTAGNTASDVTVDELTIDTVAPTVPTVDELVANTNTPTITGTLDSADEISVLVNGITYTEGDGNLTDNGDGTWELEIPVGNEIPDGTYDVVVTVTDTAGNTASDVTVDELTIDTVAPTVPTVDELVANTSTPTITGTLDSADEISVTVNTVTYTEGDGNLTDNGDGTWELEIPIGNEIPDGTYDVDVTVTDTAGNTASDATVDELTIDTVAPTVPTVDELVANTNTPTITGTLDSADEISVLVNGVTYTEGDGNLTDNGDGTWELEIPIGNEIPDGTYDVEVTVTDTAGNTASDVTVDELTIDTVAPTVPTVDELVANTNTPTITGTLDSADEISVLVNGITYTEGDGNLTDNGDGTWELEIPVGNEIPDGTYDVDVTVTDTAGNTASDATVDELTIDTVAPTVPTVDELVANTNTPTITGTLDSADEISVLVNGITYTEGDGNLTDNGDGTWELEIPVGNEIPDGTYDVVVTVTDDAGNTANDATVDEITIDTVAPTVPTVDELVANTSTPTITGTLDSADDISVIVNGVTYTEGDGDLVDNGDGTWELVIPVGNEIPDGTYDVDVTVTDAAGNTANDATVDEITIDTSNVNQPIAPTVTSQVTSDSTPLIMGTATSGDMLTVSVNGFTYQEGDGDLVDNGNDTWSLTIPTGNEIPQGTYDVVATATNSFGNSNSDSTSDELIVRVETPIGDANQSFCASDNPTLTDIVLNTSDVKWYAQASGGVALDPNSELLNGTTYYAALVVNSLESTERFGVTVTLTQPVQATLDASVDVGCLGSEITYTTEAGMVDYFWTVSTGGRIVSGGTDSDNSITVIWEAEGTQNVNVNYLSNDACLTETSADVDLLIAACSDLTIAKTVDNINPAIGEQIVYTITVTNSGQVALSDIQVEERLPSGLDFEGFNTTSGDYNNTTGIWEIPAIAANETVTLTVTVSVLDTGSYLNIARILSSNPVDADLDNNAAELQIDPDCLMVFNEFSPNGDGMNDVFTIRCIEQYPNNKVQIFNRTGQLVFTANGYLNTWNGDSNVSSSIQKSSGLPAGTYYYVLEINDGARALTGWVYIAR